MRQNAFTIVPQHHHAKTKKFSRNDRAAHRSLKLEQHGAERMNLKFLATAAAIAAFTATGAQAQTTAPSQSPNQGPSQGMGAHQNDSMSGNSGATGKRLHEKGSAKGTVGSATTTKKNHSGTAMKPGGAGMKPAAPAPSGRSGAGSDDEN